MRRRTTILVVLCATGLLFFFFAINRKPKPATETPEIPSANATAGEVGPYAPSSSRRTESASPKPGRATTQPANDAYTDQYFENTKADPTFDWKQPINFYGKVVDESNQPVEGAFVDFKWTDLSTNGTSDYRTVSDSSGLFSMLDRTGKRLSVSARKPGYYSAADARLASFEYANPADGLFTPDPASPVVFHLRKTGECEPLIHAQKLFGTRIDGTVSYIDLVEGKTKVTPSGDLTVQCMRSEPDPQRRFTWSFTIAVPGSGGLVESTNEFMFLAPADGYEPAIQISHSADESGWVSQEKRRFFVKSREGQNYARVEVTVIPRYQRAAAVDMEYFVNPSGSPNLEFDPNKEIKSVQ